MAKVSVLGSGMMGSALSRALLAKSHDVMVLDLDKSRMEPLVALGATAAGSPAELAEHADVFLPSLPTYDGLRGFLAADGVVDAMKGSMIVQLSSGSPETVTAFGEFIDGTDIDYLEGRIKTYPKEIGKSGSKIIFSGDEKVFEEAKPVLSALAEFLVYMGPELSTVAVLDEAVVVTSYGQFWGWLLAAKLCQAHGVSPMTLLEITRETVGLNFDDLEEAGIPDLISGNYRDGEGTANLRTWMDAGAQTRAAIDAAGLDTDIFDLIQGLLDKADNSGYRGKSIHAIAEVLTK